MKLDVLSLGGAALLLWGIWGAAAKPAQARIGKQVLLWSLVGDLLFLAYLAATNNLWPITWRQSGIAFALLTGSGAALATIVFYRLLTLEGASLIVPLTALYPAVTVVLGIWLLQEPFTIDRAVGVVLALVAIYFLNR